MAKRTSEDSAIVEHHGKAGRSKTPRQPKARSLRSAENEHTMSKTKKKSQTVKSDVEEKLLTTMLRYFVLKEARTFEQLSKDDHGVDIKSWSAAFKMAQENGYVEANSDEEYVLTESGVAKANTFRKDDPLKLATTDEEHHANIRKVVLKRGPEIFDLLLAEKEALTNKEIAAKLGCQEGAHTFFYSLQGLKVLGIVGVHPDCRGRSKKLCLTGKAFLDGKQREYELHEDVPKKSQKKEKHGKKSKASSAKGKAAGKKDEEKEKDNQTPGPDEDPAMKDPKTSTKKKKAPKKQVSKSQEKGQGETKDENDENLPSAGNQVKDCEPKKSKKKRPRESQVEVEEAEDNEAELKEPKPKKARNTEYDNKKASTKANDASTKKQPENAVEMEVDQAEIKSVVENAGDAMAMEVEGQDKGKAQDKIESKQAEDATAMEVEGEDNSKAQNKTEAEKAKDTTVMEVEGQDDSKGNQDNEPKADNKAGELNRSKQEGNNEGSIQATDDRVNTGDKEEDGETKEENTTRKQVGTTEAKIVPIAEAEEKAASEVSNTIEVQASKQDARKGAGSQEREGSQVTKKEQAASTLFNDEGEASGGAQNKGEAKEPGTTEGKLAEVDIHACACESSNENKAGNGNLVSEEMSETKPNKLNEKGPKLEEKGKESDVTMEVVEEEATPKADKAEPIEKGSVVGELPSTSRGETKQADFADTAKEALAHKEGQVAKEAPTEENFKKIGIEIDSNKTDE